MPSDPLSELRDIHLPEELSMFPLQPGWWLLILSIFALIVFLIVLRRRIKAKAAQRIALAALKTIKNQYDINHNQATFFSELSILLRRYALSQFPRQKVAALVGEDWLRFLDKTGGQGKFNNGVGRLLVTAPYRLQEERADTDALVELSRRWIKSVKA